MQATPSRQNLAPVLCCSWCLLAFACCDISALSRSVHFLRKSNLLLRSMRGRRRCSSVIVARSKRLRHSSSSFPVSSSVPSSALIPTHTRPALTPRLQRPLSETALLPVITPRNGATALKSCNIAQQSLRFGRLLLARELMPLGDSINNDTAQVPLGVASTPNFRPTFFLDAHYCHF